MNYFRSTASGEVFSLPDRLAVTPPNGCERVVVISPEDREQVERLTGLIYDAATDRPYVGGATDGVQAALRSLVTDPKPDEPQGLGAVVEDAEGCRWWRSATQASVWRKVARNSDGKSYVLPESLAFSRRYDEINAVRVLSEGWSE